ncbi:ANK-REP-REGION domain-containing protein [Mycena venus]|uniref:ANK-REP-REGION domain-containing protein n=1 Tax=Mycena venus TaxID=2733690 RepID=A0A8H7D9R7_9AGAR|nr:ANK-REP-REGION domain-containing protein [Mycena venus]
MESGSSESRVINNYIYGGVGGNGGGAGVQGQGGGGGVGEGNTLNYIFGTVENFTNHVYHGKVGENDGKLLSVVVNHLDFETRTSPRTITVACLYLNHKETQIQTPSNLLAGLWRQLVFEKPISTDSVVQNLYKRHSEKGTRPTLAEIHEVLFLAVAQWSKAYIVVDALDEYPEDDRMVLLEQLTTLGSTVNLMVTSRPHIREYHEYIFANINIRQNLKTDIRIQIEIRASDEDIRKYVNQRIQAHYRLRLHVQTSPDLREYIITKILKAVDGMFLLAKLHTESLMGKSTVKLVRETLEYLPKDLDAAYKDTMGRINQQQTCDRELALAALTWVANAKRVLKVTELREALAVKAGAKNIDPDDRPEISIILDVCAGLIIVNSQGWDTTVRLVHYSTQNFLDGLFPDPHTDITRTLLTYLAMDEVHSYIHEVQIGQPMLVSWGAREYPLIHYCEYCLIHAVGQPEVELCNMILDFLAVAAQWHRRMYQWDALPWNFLWSSSPSPLWVAAAANLLKIAEYLLDHGGAPNNENKAMSALCVASSRGHLQMVKLFKGASEELGRDCNALRLASQYGHIEVVQFLLESGADVNAEEPPTLEPDGPRYLPRTALEAAILEGHSEIVHLLFENGANINVLGRSFPRALYAASGNGRTEIVRQVLEDTVARHNSMEGPSRASVYDEALMLAAWMGHTETCRLLLANGADVDTVNLHSHTPLWNAALKGHTETVRLLLEEGANVNKMLTLRMACSLGHTKVVRLLLQTKVDIKEVGKALADACLAGRRDVILLLLDKGADINFAAKYGTPLSLASQNGHTQVVRLLLEKGADVNVATGNDGTALCAASSRGRTEIVQLLLDNGADVNFTAGKYGTALFRASQNGRTEVVDLLLEKGADVNATAGNDGTALCAASSGGHTEVVHLLLQNGTDINGAGEYGTALCRASENGHTDVVDLLLKKGPNVNAMGGARRSALAAAFNEGHTDIVRLVLENGADVNAIGKDSDSALYLASEKGHTQIVRLLLEKGASVNKASENCLNSLQTASKEGHTEIVQILLEHGADVNAMGGGEGTALHLALKNGHRDIVRLLEKGAGQ